jgi:Domain of unknown function (DUF4381)
MSPTWLAQLAPEHRPAAPPWWPPAPGWWLIAALFLVLLAAMLGWRRFSRHARSGKVQRVALLELERIRSQGDDGAAAHAIQQLLRRYALTVFGPDRVARLTGDSWIEFIVLHGGAGLSGDHGRWLLRAAFGTSPASSHRESWLSGAEAFIRQAPRHARRRGAGA